MAITTAMVKELREATGAGILDSKKALEAADGNFDKAVELLREKGLAKAAKKASRDANDGLVEIAVNGKAAALVEVNCETDFVARTDGFKTFVESVTQQVLKQDSLTSVDDLLNADYGNDKGKTVANAIQETISQLGENIVVRRFERYNQDGPGVIKGYIHMGGRIGVLVELGVEDATTNKDALLELAHDLTLHVAATNPRFLSRGDVPADVVEEEKKIYLAQVAQENKPDKIKEKIVEGRLNKFYKEICLLEQPFVKDDSLSVTKLLQQQSKSLGTPIKINRYTRYELGVS